MSENQKSPVKQSAEPSETTVSDAATPQNAQTDPTTPQSPAEFGGRKGLEATRYGDWEMNGKCVDF